VSGGEEALVTYRGHPRVRLSPLPPHTPRTAPR